MLTKAQIQTLLAVITREIQEDDDALYPSYLEDRYEVTGLELSEAATALQQMTAPRKTLVARVDVTGLPEREIHSLMAEMEVQCEQSDEYYDPSEEVPEGMGYGGHRSVGPVHYDIVEDPA